MENKDKLNKYKLKSKAELKELLTDMQYEVTQNNGTEPPFKNEYHDKFEEEYMWILQQASPCFYPLTNLMQAVAGPASQSLSP